MPKRVGCSATDAKRIHELHSQGVSIRKISNRLDICRTYVQQIVRGNYFVRQEDNRADAADCIRSASGIKCECNTLVLELFKMPDGRHLCLACSLRSRQLREGMIPLKSIPPLPNHDTSWPVDDYVIPVDDDDELWGF